MTVFKKQVLVNLPEKEINMLEEMVYKMHMNKTAIIKIAIEDLYNHMKDSNTV